MSEGEIYQSDLSPIIRDAVDNGETVHLLTDVHGGPGGNIEAEFEFFGKDLQTFGDLEGVVIHDMSTLSNNQIRKILNGPGTIIGSFCYSGKCLQPRIKG